MTRTRYSIYGCMLLGLIVLSFGCATEPDPLNRTQPEALNKKMFEGLWRYNVTVTDAEYENHYTFIGEQGYTGTTIRWEITLDKLNGILVPQTFTDAEGNPVKNELNSKSVILSFPIKKHFDIRYRYNSTTREELNVIEENTDRPWNEREYMEVDWSNNQGYNLWVPLGFDYADGVINRENVAIYENVDFYTRNPDAAKADNPEEDVKIDTRQWNPGKDPEVYAMNIDTKESISTNFTSRWWWYNGYILNATPIRFRHSLIKAPSPDQVTYQPLEYRDDLYRRFGFFRTTYNVFDNQRSDLTETAKRYYAQRWDLSGNKKITWYMSPDFQEAFDAGDTVIKDWALEAAGSWNKAFQDALPERSNDTMIELKPNEPLLGQDGKQLTRADGTKRWKYELGDLRFPMFNVTFRKGRGMPCGYGPSSADASTGEIFHGLVNIYAGECYDWITKRAMDLYDLASGHCTVEEFKNGRYYNPQTGKCDAGVTTKPLNGPVAAGGSDGKNSSAKDERGDVKDPLAAIRFLSPALKSAYWPKSDINQPTNKDLRFSAKEITKIKERLADEIQHPTMADLGGFQRLAGSKYETQILPLGNMYSLLPDSAAGNLDMLADYAPWKRLTPDAVEAMQNMTIQAFTAKDDVEMFEPGINQFVKDMKNEKDRNVVERTLRHWIYITSMIHEMGHTLGLRHNFMGSVDSNNFPNPITAQAPQGEYTKAVNEYWAQIEKLRKDYQTKIDAGDADAYNKYIQAVDGIASTKDRYASSSIMDYLGDWSDWSIDARPYDRAAILFGYGQKVEVDAGIDKKSGQRIWKVEDYKPGDFEPANPDQEPLDNASKSKSGRRIRQYLYCSDDRVFEDVFCSWHDRGVTATEIVRNYIADAQINYYFNNFRRDRSNFSQRSYLMRKWQRDYYTHAKPLTQYALNSSRYPEFWDALVGVSKGWDNSAIVKVFNEGPETKDLKPGYYRDGAEDILRSMMLIYYYYIYDVIMRPDYGQFQLNYNSISGAYEWKQVERTGADDSKPTLNIPAGVGWGFADIYDVTLDPAVYDDKLQRIGVELDKTLALEALSMPCIFSRFLRYQKANGATYWNQFLTGDGSQLWQIIRGIVTDNFNHVQNPYCAKCDKACRENPKDNPPQIRTYPIRLMESLAVKQPDGPNRCGGEDEYPIEPGYDMLFAIQPMFWALEGATHPWYHNELVEHLDSQLKGGNHRFEIPKDIKPENVAEFVNGMGTKIYQAVQTSDGLSISFDLVKRGQEIRERFEYVRACMGENPENKDLLKDKPSIHQRTCDDLIKCYPQEGEPADWCAVEGWDTSFNDLNANLSQHYALNRIEAMLIMMQDMVDLVGHYNWRLP